MLTNLLNELISKLADVHDLGTSNTLNYTKSILHQVCLQIKNLTHQVCDLNQHSLSNLGGFLVFSDDIAVVQTGINLNDWLSHNLFLVVLIIRVNILNWCFGRHSKELIKKQA
jgi:hypothetical protein